MKFEQNPEIEELLNSYLDSELSDAESAEVQRLVRKDPDIARRLHQLEQCKTLVSSLPPAEPPAEVVSGLRELLRNKSSTARRTVPVEQQRGAKHLLVRQVLAAAVIIVLVGLLGAVIYKIVGPENTSPQTVAVRPTPTVTPRVMPLRPETTVAKATDTATVCVYSLRLVTNDFVAVDAFVNKLLEESSWLQYNATKEQHGRSIYGVICSRAGLAALVNDLSTVWTKFDSATLLVHTADIGQYVTIESVRPEQINEIANQNTLDGQIKVAKNFAVLNNIERAAPAEQMLATADHSNSELPTIPRPVLTSGEKRVEGIPENPSDRVRVDLTIVVSEQK